MIKQSLYGGGLFVSKKLVILDGIPLDMFKTQIEGEERILFKFNMEQYEKLTEEIMNNEVGIPDDTLLICISYKPDKRGRFYKFISKEGQVKEFSPPDVSKAKNFIRQQADGLNLNEETVTSVLEKVGTDQFCLVSEIEKLRFWKARNPETPLDSTIVDQICF
ncbi:MAG: hypothetical protein LBI53_03305 [Candidatus Peribacteria bacterium]|jgi:DNA polymerase III delta subunit|nr:hypothetical protein [Candidatus Peribacteria bacterium]